MTSPSLNQNPTNENDETIQDVLSSIRRILHEDPSQKPADKNDDEELTLDSSMMVSPPTSATPSPQKDPETAHQNELMGAGTMAAAERSLDALHAAFNERRARNGMQISSDTVVSSAGGMTIENMVRAEVREMVRTWLDAHLPSMVEILVRSEIAKLRPRD
ncbi:DUF2497 domain-containing protein [Gluconobacter wancherniae]|uniref:DUF2497 domain-containing protein n=1 Tax=Gluconobacter wancherniae TaxID=1307955 RepID=UPI001B8CB8F0|nr:DUF2497 domain-containing protein [Gluconobacter wancherniae]MBS1094033.1 DUF2497 domain-containing protein [Gluconobacter wancherniae]